MRWVCVLVTRGHRIGSHNFSKKQKTKEGRGGGLGGGGGGREAFTQAKVVLETRLYSGVLPMLTFVAISHPG